MTDIKTRFNDFKAGLEILINKNSLEETLEMPDFLIANLLTDILQAMYAAHLDNGTWHGGNKSL